jgi:hypothetical protein
LPEEEENRQQTFSSSLFIQAKDEAAEMQVRKKS